MSKSGTAAILGIAATLISAGGISACATTASKAHWEKPGGDKAAFQADNERCGRVASRVGSSCSATPSSCGASIPPNQIDKPPHVDANPIWQRSFMECMADRGWHVAQE